MAILAAAVGVTLFRVPLLARFEVPFADRVRIVREKHAAISAAEFGVQEPIEITSADAQCGSVPAVAFTDRSGKRVSVQFSEYVDDATHMGRPDDDDATGWRLIVRRPPEQRNAGKRLGYDSRSAKAFHGLMIRWFESPRIQKRIAKLLNAPDRTKGEIAELAEYDRKVSSGNTDGRNAHILRSLRYHAVAKHRPKLPLEDRSLLKACAYLHLLDRIYCSDRRQPVRGKDEFPRWKWSRE